MSDPQRWLTLAERVHHRLAHHRRGVALLVYASLLLAATALASAFSVGLDFGAVGWTDAVLMGGLLVLVRLPLYWRVQLGIGRWRFVGVGEVIRLAGATVLGSIVVGVLAFVLPGLDATVSVMLLEIVLSVALISGVWISYRALFEYARRLSGLNGHGSGLGGNAKHRRVLVAGAGEAGRMIVHQMLRSRRDVTIVGFVDDDPLKWGTAIHGKEVVGSVEDLPAIVEYEGVDELLIAMPSMEPAALRRIVDTCGEIDIEVRVLPGLDEVLRGGSRWTRSGIFASRISWGATLSGWSYPSWRRTSAGRPSSSPGRQGPSDRSWLARSYCTTLGRSSSWTKPRVRCISSIGSWWTGSPAHASCP